MNIRRTTLIITQKCTLKCKLCLAFVPYFEKPVHTPYKDACVIIDNYFKVVDNVQIFSITGGEPLMHPDLVKILEQVLCHKDKITGTIDMVTNGTIKFKDELLNLLENNKDKMRVIISNYGDSLSVNLGEVEKSVKERGINYRIQNYDDKSDSWTYNGWVDFSDHSLKHKTKEEVLKQAKKCIFRAGHYYVINDGELHPCSRQYWRMREGILNKDDNWYIDLNHIEMSVDVAREKLKFLESTEYLNSCAYCNGCWNGIERHKPAEQL